MVIKEISAICMCFYEINNDIKQSGQNIVTFDSNGVLQTSRNVNARFIIRTA